MNNNNQERADLYRSILMNDDDGKKIVEDLQLRFYDRLIYQKGGIEAERETTFRAGQQSVVHYIFQQLAYVAPEVIPDE